MATTATATALEGTTAVMETTTVHATGATETPATRSHVSPFAKARAARAAAGTTTTTKTTKTTTIEAVAKETAKVENLATEKKKETKTEKETTKVETLATEKKETKTEKETETASTAQKTSAQQSDAHLKPTQKTSGQKGGKMSGAGAKKRKDGGGKQKKQTQKKQKIGDANAKFTKKDWTCSKCSYTNYSKNKECRKCKTSKPVKSGRNAAEEYLAAWAIMERTEVEPIHHEYLLKQVGMLNELREEFFEFFVQYCASMVGDRRKRMRRSAIKAHIRMTQVVDALANKDVSQGGSDSDGDGESESGSESEEDKNPSEVPTDTTMTDATPAAELAVAPSQGAKKNKSRGNRGGKRGRGGAGGATKAAT